MHTSSDWTWSLTLTMDCWRWTCSAVKQQWEDNSRYNYLLMWPPSSKDILNVNIYWQPLLHFQMNLIWCKGICYANSRSHHINNVVEIVFAVAKWAELDSWLSLAVITLLQSQATLWNTESAQRCLLHEMSKQSYADLCVWCWQMTEPLLMLVCGQSKHTYSALIAASSFADNEHNLQLVDVVN